MDFNFAYFPNFNFAFFEIEESFGLVWVKLQKARFHLRISSLGIQKVPVSCMGFIFAIFVYKGSFGQIRLKIAERSIRLENFHFVARFTSYGVPFCSFWI